MKKMVQLKEKETLIPKIQQLTMRMEKRKKEKTLKKKLRKKKLND